MPHRRGSSPGAGTAASGACCRPTGSRHPTARTGAAARHVGSSSSGSPVSRSRSSSRPRRRSGARRETRRRSRRRRRRPARAARPRVGQARLRACALAVERPRRERTVRDELGARLLRDAPGAAEVVGMRVRDDDGVDVRSLKPADFSRVLSAFHDCGPGQPGVDDGEAAVVEEAVRVHVAEAGHPDRQLHAQDAGRDLDDLLGRRLLLLLLRLRRPGCPVGVTRPTRHVGHALRLLDRPVKPPGAWRSVTRTPAARTSATAAGARGARRRRGRGRRRGGRPPPGARRGRPSTSPTGMLAAGWPVMLNGAVNARRQPMRFTSLPATAPVSVPSARNAVVGVVGVRSTSTCSNRRGRRRASARGDGGSPCTSRSGRRFVISSTPARCTSSSSSRCSLSKSRWNAAVFERRQDAPRHAGLRACSTGTSTSSRPASSTSDIAASCATFSTSGSAPA